MALKDLLKATKVDRYTQDGRDELNKALQADVEDVKYKTGDISQATGLQKQPDGSWAPPKGSSAAKHQKAMEGAKKVGIVNKVPAGWKKAEGVTTTPNGYVAITNGGSRFPKEGQAKREVKFIKQEDFEKGNAKPDGSKVTMKHDGNKITSTEYEAPEGKWQNSDALDFVHKLPPLNEAKTDQLFEAQDKLDEEWIAKKGNVDKERFEQAKALIKGELNKRGTTGKDYWAWKKTAGDSAPRELTGDTKIRIRK